MDSMQREYVIRQLQSAATEQVDCIVIGGGATGLGIAVDAAQRGLSVVLLEAHDFAKGTSSRATKLLHGGVRYLEQGNIALVREALHERETVIANAPYVAQPLAFITPAQTLWQKLKYGIGLKAYQWLAGKRSLGQTRWFGAVAARQRFISLQAHRLKYGAVKYWDAQFDDARLALELALKARELGAVVVNYCVVSSLVVESGKVVGVRAQDAFTEQEFELRSGCVINATGVWADGVRQMTTDSHRASATGLAVATPHAIVQPSQGAHVVLDASFWPHEQALLVPKTADGRVLFAVPWQGKVVVGTTDTAVPQAEHEPVPLADEIDFILQEASAYLQKSPQRADVLSTWAGLRPLVNPAGYGDSAGNTAQISREHTVEILPSGLVTVAGGKWTTYRSMADDALNQCVQAGLLPAQTAQCQTAELVLQTRVQNDLQNSAEHSEQTYGYGARYADVLQCGGAGHWFIKPENNAETAHDGCALSEAMVRYAVRYEMARTVEDVLARRRRVLFLNARQAQMAAPQVAKILRDEGVEQPQLAAFMTLAAAYLVQPQDEQ